MSYNGEHSWHGCSSWSSRESSSGKNLNDVCESLGGWLCIVVDMLLCCACSPISQGFRAGPSISGKSLSVPSMREIRF